jgi:hypothetical protein
VDGDVSKKETAIKVVDAAVKHFGRIDWRFKSTRTSKEFWTRAGLVSEPGRPTIPQEPISGSSRQKRNQLLTISNNNYDRSVIELPINGEERR